MVWFDPVEDTGRVTELVLVVESLVFSDFLGSGVGLLLFTFEEPDEIGTNGGISLGGIDLKPGLFAESRPDSFESSAGLFLLSTDPGFSLDFSASFFSNGGIIDFDGEGSFPMLLHVWARRASGLFLASS